MEGAARGERRGGQLRGHAGAGNEPAAELIREEMWVPGLFEHDTVYIGVSECQDGARCGMHLDGCHNRVAVLAGGKRIAALAAGIYKQNNYGRSQREGFFFYRRSTWHGGLEWEWEMMNVGDVEVVCVEHQMMAKMNEIHTCI